MHKDDQGNQLFPTFDAYCENNGIVTVHVGVAKGRFQAPLDAELYLSQSWAADRVRCRDVGIPDDVRYQSKWPIALDQLIRLHHNGVHFDWLVFDEGYGSKVPFLWVLGLVGQKLVAEVPVSFTVRDTAGGPARRADERPPATRTGRWQRFRLARKTLAAQVWRAKATRVWAARNRIERLFGEAKEFRRIATRPTCPTSRRTVPAAGTTLLPVTVLQA